MDEAAEAAGLQIRSDCSGVNEQFRRCHKTDSGGGLSKA